MSALIAAKSETVKKMVSDKIKSMEAYAEMIQRERDKDPEYQSLLATTLSLLPTLADLPAEDLKKRLAPFNEDPVARHAIEAALRNARSAAAGKNGYNIMFNMDVLPVYTLPEKIERLKKLERTMLTQLNDMGLEVDKMAVLYNHVTPQNIKRLPFYTATADYIRACNDDCTEYFPENHKATQFVKTE